MTVCPIVVLVLFATAALLLPSTHCTRLSVAQENIKKLQEQVAQLSKSISQESHTAGAVYVRWGSASCPETAQLGYSGVVGGGFFSHLGAAANALCMPKNPVYDSQGRTEYSSYLFGAEYETAKESTQNLDVVCAVCLSPREMQIMVPATNQCLDGWTREYSGHLMAGFHGFAASTEYLCMDSAMEYTQGSEADNNGKMFYYTVGRCGSLPCPPYVNDQVLTCVVCSK